MLISPAYAQAAGTPASGFDLISILPLVLIFVVFYFLLIRPQQKKMKEHKARIAKVRRGDRIVTAGGVIGTVTRVSDEEAQVEIAEGVRIRVVKSTIADIRAKAEPFAGKAGDDEQEEEPEEPRQASKQ